MARRVFRRRRRKRFDRQRASPRVDADAAAAGWPRSIPEATVNLTGDFSDVDRTEPRTDPGARRQRRHERCHARTPEGAPRSCAPRATSPSPGELAKTATAPTKQVKGALEELKNEYASRGMQLDEGRGGWDLRTNAAYAPFVRDLARAAPPVKLPGRRSRRHDPRLPAADHVRPEVDEIRGVDCDPS